MKVLHIINNLGSGGAEKLLDDLIPLINKNKSIETDILLLTDKNNVFFDSLIKKGVRVDIVKYRNMYDFRNIFAIKNYISKGDYDIVHSHVFPAQYWVALSKMFIRNKKVKFITTEHSTYNRRRDKFYLRKLEKIIYYQYDLIISITEQTKDNLINWIDPKREEMQKYIVVKNGVDIERIKKALPYKKSELIEGINENSKLVCMVGRFSEAKDQLTLLEAISNLSEEIHLVLVGEGPLMLKNIKIAIELGVSDRVHFLGFRQDVPEILKTVDIVVLSSHWEGLSLASIEGLASGKPFIASRVPGLEEIVEGSGLLFNPGDHGSLVNLIEKLYEDSNFYTSIADRCIRKAKEYSIKDTASSIITEYKSLIKKP